MDNHELVGKLADLSRLQIEDDARDALAKEFESILAYVGALDSLSLEVAAEPDAGTVRNVFREDAHPHEEGAYTKTIVEAFPEREGDTLKVKQILSYDE